MKKRNKTILAFLTLLGLVIAVVLYKFWPRNYLEIQVRQTQKSPDGKWTAVVQMEVYNSAGVVNDAVYAVRIKGAQQKNAAGDLVMNVPVNYPYPEPDISWSNEKLVIVLRNQQKYQYLSSPVDGIAVIVQQN